MLHRHVGTVSPEEARIRDPRNRNALRLPLIFVKRVVEKGEYLTKEMREYIYAEIQVFFS